MKKTNHFELRMVYNLTARVSYFLVSNFLFYLSVALPSAWLIFFAPSLMNMIAIGWMFPGLAALVSCGVKHKEVKQEAEFYVLKYFVEGYKKNFKDTINYCFIYAALIYVVNFNIIYYTSGMPLFMIVALVILTTLSTLIVTYMMIIASKFQFRTRDLLKVSFYCLIMHVKTTIRIFMIYIILFFAYPWIGAFIMFLFISPIISIIIHFAYPILEDVHENFIEKSE
jgi:uncharacterized membrane protein YesL